MILYKKLSYWIYGRPPDDQNYMLVRKQHCPKRLALTNHSYQKNTINTQKQKK